MVKTTLEESGASTARISLSTLPSSSSTANHLSATKTARFPVTKSLTKMRERNQEGDEPELSCQTCTFQIGPSDLGTLNEDKRERRAVENVLQMLEELGTSEFRQQIRSGDLLSYLSIK